MGIEIHDRMPVILRSDDYALWLDPAFINTASVSQMLRPFDPAVMRRYPVSTRINHVDNDDADCAKPSELDPSPVQSFLF
jgi:putative SOS response-associated peptidase YedK